MYVVVVWMSVGDGDAEQRRVSDVDDVMVVVVVVRYDGGDDDE